MKDLLIAAKSRIHNNYGFQSLKRFRSDLNGGCTYDIYPSYCPDKLYHDGLFTWPRSTFAIESWRFAFSSSGVNGLRQVSRVIKRMQVQIFNANHFLLLWDENFAILNPVRKSNRFIEPVDFLFWR